MTKTTAHDDSSSPKERRVKRRNEVARRLCRSVLAEKSTKIQIAADIGVSDTQFDRWVAVDGDQSMPFEAVGALPKSTAIDMLDMGAAWHGCVVVQLPSAALADTDIAHVVAVQAESSDVVTASLRAMSSAAITGSVATAVRKEIREAVQALLALDLVMERAERERVVAVTGLRAVVTGGAK